MCWAIPHCTLHTLIIHHPIRRILNWKLCAGASDEHYSRKLAKCMRTINIEHHVPSTPTPLRSRFAKMQSKTVLDVIIDDKCLFMFFFLLLLRQQSLIYKYLAFEWRDSNSFVERHLLHISNWCGIVLISNGISHSLWASSCVFYMLNTHIHCMTMDRHTPSLN